MRPFMSIPLLLLVITSFGSLSFAMTTTLETLCSNLGGGYVDYNTCISTLGADPRSHTANDYPTLASISIDLCVRNATTIKSRVTTLLTNDTYSAVRSGLSACMTLYSNVIPALRWSSDAIAAKRYADASQTITDSVGVPSACDQTFDKCDGQNDSPLLKENSGFSSLAVVAQAIANVMNHS